MNMVPYVSCWNHGWNSGQSAANSKPKFKSFDSLIPPACIIQLKFQIAFLVIRWEIQEKKNENLTEAQNQANWKMYEARRSLQGREQKRMPRLQQQSAKIQWRKSLRLLAAV